MIENVYEDTLLRSLVLVLWGISLIYVYRTECKVNPHRRASKPFFVAFMVGLVLWPISLIAWLILGNRNPTQKDRTKAQEWAKQQLKQTKERISEQ